MDFYNDLITKKSWETLTELKNKIDFVLIGGWAVYLYTKALKSKDIDLIVNYDQLDKLRKDFAVIKNERLLKYEARREEVQIDIYLPHYSDLGLPIEKILKNTQKLETFQVPKIETLLDLKLYVYGQRKLSAKGQKDRLDMLSLLLAAPVVPKLSKELITIINQITKIPELGVNEYTWSKKKKLLLTKI